MADHFIDKKIKCSRYLKIVGNQLKVLLKCLRQKRKLTEKTTTTEKPFKAKTHVEPVDDTKPSEIPEK
jgi:hypothetical protein